MKKAVFAFIVVIAMLGAGLAAAQVTKKKPTRVTGCMSESGELDKFTAGTSPDSSCDSGDTVVTFHKRGKRGKVGATGSAGEQGEQGEQGQQGVAGIAGEAGPKGDTGASGAKGDTGPKGDTGAKGETGAKGDAAPAGAVGTATNPGGQTSTSQTTSSTTHTVIERTFTAEEAGQVSVAGSFNYLSNDLGSNITFFVSGWVTVNRSCVGSSAAGADFSSQSTRQWRSLNMVDAFSVSEGVNTVRVCLSARANDDDWTLEHDNGHVVVTYVPQALELN